MSMSSTCTTWGVWLVHAKTGFRSPRNNDLNSLHRQSTGTVEAFLLEWNYLDGKICILEGTVGVLPNYLFMAPSLCYQRTIKIFFATLCDPNTSFKFIKWNKMANLTKNVNIWVKKCC